MIMEPLMATAAEATDMLRVGRSAVYQLIAARQRESIKIGRPQARIGRFDPPRRSPECGVFYGGRSGFEVVIVWRRSRSARMVNGELDTGQCLAVGKSPDTSVARSTPNAG
jgi:hypothetical protein